MLTANHRRTLRGIPHWLHLPGEPVDHASRLRSRGYTAEEAQKLTWTSDAPHGQPPYVCAWRCQSRSSPEYSSFFPVSDSDGEDNHTDVDERGCVTRP
jgi:hypothetical protein